MNEMKVARGLGWFSIGLGLTEVLAGRSLGPRPGDGRSGRAAPRLRRPRDRRGGQILSQDNPRAGVWARVVGDVLDLAALGSAFTEDNPERDNVAAAIGTVAGITALDYWCAGGSAAGGRTGRSGPPACTRRTGRATAPRPVTPRPTNRRLRRRRAARRPTSPRNTTTDREEHHESALLARQERRPRRHRPRPEDRGPARRDHQDHVHRHLRLRPPPLRRLHADDGGRRHPRPRADGRGRRGRQRGQEAEEGRPGRRPVHDLLRRVLLLPEGSSTRCCDTSNPNAEIARKAMGQSPAGLFGYSHMLGGYAGGQAEYLRVPYADVGPIKIPDGLPDEKVLFLSDIFPTGYMAAENAEIEPGDTVAVWGCGPVGQFAIRAPGCSGPGRVIAIDRVPERLADGPSTARPRRSTSTRRSVYDQLHGDDQGPRPGPLHRRGRVRGPRRRAASTRCSTRRRRRSMLATDRAARPARGDHVLPQGRHGLDPRRLRRLPGQDPVRRGR